MPRFGVILSSLRYTSSRRVVETLDVATTAVQRSLTYNATNLYETDRTNRVTTQRQRCLLIPVASSRAASSNFKFKI